jgi:hypothetical protein
MAASVRRDRVEARISCAVVGLAGTPEQRRDRRKEEQGIDGCREEAIVEQVGAVHFGPIHANEGV